MQLRKVEVLEEGNWESLELRFLKVGDRFRLTDDKIEGLPRYEDGSKVYVALETPFMEPDGLWGVRAAEVK